jgi:3-phosphoshikimate 1-carboxyvinyltransferase
MSMAIAGLVSSAQVEIDEIEAIDVSYPNFFEHLNELM